MHTDQHQAYEGNYQGESAIYLKSGNYEAIVLPRIGGNLIAFRDVALGLHFLHEPDANEMEAFRSSPVRYGIPVLFPPNRYEDGRLHWKGKNYQFPINEQARNNHIHGYLHTTAWKVEKYGADESESRVTLCLTFDDSHEMHSYFPHEFTIKLSYSLSANGLLQHVMVQNQGQQSMPCLLGFHTALNAPFDPNSAADDYTFKITIGERIQLSERSLPTGVNQPLSSAEEKMKNEGISPYFEAMDHHYTAVPQDGRNRMVLTDHRTATTLVYDAGSAYKHWMIWNNGASGKFFCPEPQINRVNAPNLNQPAEQTGLVELRPHEIWEETSRIYIYR